MIHSYLGVDIGSSVIRLADNAIRISQGGLELEVRLLEENSHPLRAPQRGSMTRTIHESASCVVQYICRREGRVLFDVTSRQASFESAWREVGV